MKNPIILLTGAGRPAGQALAVALATRGATIAAVDINPLGLGACLQALTAVGGRGKDYVFDATKRLPVVALVQNVLDDWGRVDVLINAAEADPKESLFLLDEWDFHRALDVNVGGPFLLIQRVGQIMKEQGNGLIINLGVATTPAGVAYCLGKAALAALTDVAAQELTGLGISVTSIAQGEKMIEEIVTAVDRLA